MHCADSGERCTTTEIVHPHTHKLMICRQEKQTGRKAGRKRRKKDGSGRLVGRRLLVIESCCKRLDPLSYSLAHSLPSSRLFCPVLPPHLSQSGLQTRFTPPTHRLQHECQWISPAFLPSHALIPASFFHPLFACSAVRTDLRAKAAY